MADPHDEKAVHGIKGLLSLYLGERPDAELEAMGRAILEISRAAADPGPDIPHDREHAILLGHVSGALLNSTFQTHGMTEVISIVDLDGNNTDTIVLVRAGKRYRLALKRERDHNGQVKAPDALFNRDKHLPSCKCKSCQAAAELEVEKAAREVAEDLAKNARASAPVDGSLFDDLINRYGLYTHTDPAAAFVISNVS